MKNITVYFVRHGQTYFNRYNRMQGWADSPLTEKGILDAESTGKRLAQIHFDRAYSSDTTRARSTAQLILNANQASEVAKPQDIPYFREQFYGYFEGEPSNQAWHMAGAPHGAGSFGEIVTKYSIDKSKDFMKAADPFHDAENSTEYWARLLLGFDLLRKENQPGDHILLVSHGTTMRSIVAKYGDGQYDVTKSPRNGCVTKLLINENGIEIAYYNRIDEGPLE
ncbi:histidine phosphatase family protein [Loigolactobacillus bifermentans]|uniref:Phosphoglycerate mutase n=1 Tax=Loigolactobacillus bifermentans DSM 20003 TaxID=1423726 RepID=A0A0R1GKL9_9LACO|nr:phosphoglycerate mutase family protein [Loigolactobacillus bifermentans]KRK34629.1 phosphoglycerate mutase [Loigolactobacillus bifermentans DSM 20003]QGG61100.1 histidine phosphatase family protein [Loigolactobacillus bifermentans]